VFERFTDQARACIAHAQEEAAERHHPYIGSEHFLLGLIRDEDSTAARVLTGLGARLTELRAATDAIIGREKREVAGHIPFTPGAKRVLEMSLRDALNLGDTHIGSEHLLLGLVREGDGVGAQVLTTHGLTHARIREQVRRLMDQESEPFPLVGGPEVYDADDLSLRLSAILARLATIEGRLSSPAPG
jgi:ATP-dependent Clp protease ATP-binding subunit ClpC